ncbi:hypothetical protein [Clostridium beijerinckii]|uniref:hypothetical protein n=1 Tax=Clostridium beijerinckii TaxID=1520 RepID=UPI0018FE771F|nr:hypothetical protein [Clostridium beijerinckii]
MNRLDRRIKNVGSGGIYSAFSIDNIFRCMLVSLRDYKNMLTEGEMTLIKKKLDVFEQKRIIEDIRRNF